MFSTLNKTYVFIFWEYYSHFKIIITIITTTAIATLRVKFTNNMLNANTDDVDVNTDYKHE